MIMPISTGNIRMFLASCDECGVQGEYDSRDAAALHHHGAHSVDGAPHGADLITDPYDSPSYAGMAAA